MQWGKNFFCCFLLHHPVWFFPAVENSLLLCPIFLLLVPLASSLLPVWGSSHFSQFGDQLMGLGKVVRIYLEILKLSSFGALKKLPYSIHFLLLWPDQLLEASFPTLVTSAGLFSFLRLLQSQTI